MDIAYACMRVCGSVHLCAETPHFSLFIFLFRLLRYHVCVTPSFKLSSSRLCGSHATTAVAHHARPFLTATGGASVRACACHVPYSNRHIILREVQGCCAGGRAIQTHTSAPPRDFNRNRVATATTAAVKQQHNSSSASNSSGTTAV